MEGWREGSIPPGRDGMVAPVEVTAYIRMREGGRGQGGGVRNRREEKGMRRGRNWQGNVFGRMEVPCVGGPLERIPAVLTFGNAVRCSGGNDGGTILCSTRDVEAGEGGFFLKKRLLLHTAQIQTKRPDFSGMQ